MLRTAWKVIPNGLNDEFWVRLHEIQRDPKKFFTVFSPSQFFLKGGDLIIAIAEKFPECTFYIAGTDAPAHLSSYSENVHFLGKLSAGELREYYSRCRFHFQLSVFEGFGLTLCEAMLCECIPIGSRVNFIPEIIGSSGFILDHRDADELELLIRKALNSRDTDQMGKAARQSIIDRFSLQNRRDMLMAELG